MVLFSFAFEQLKRILKVLVWGGVAFVPQQPGDNPQLPHVLGRRPLCHGQDEFLEPLLGRVFLLEGSLFGVFRREAK